MSSYTDMKNSILYFCSNCGDDSNEYNMKKEDGSYNYQCKFCNNELISTNISITDWERIFILENPQYKNNIDDISITMVADFARQKLIENGTLHLNQVAMNARIEDNEHRKNNFLSKPRCPKCGSTSFHSEKRGFSTGRAVAAGALTGFLDVAAVAGMVGKDKMVNVCDSCGYKWK